MTSSGLMERVLSKLENGPLIEAAIARQMNMDPANIRRALKDMERLCLIAKVDGAWRKTRLI